MKQRCKEDGKAEADGEMIMFTYLGKKKNVRNATVSDGSSTLRDDGSGNQSYILIPGKLVASQIMAVALIETEKKNAFPSEGRGAGVTQVETNPTRHGTQHV